MPPGPARLLGLTERDLFVPVLSFVYGQAQLEGRVAVVSLARLRPDFLGLGGDPALLERRAGVEAVHEVAVDRPRRPRPQDGRALPGLLGAAGREP